MSTFPFNETNSLFRFGEVNLQSLHRIFRETLKRKEDKIDPMCPATFMRLHRDAIVVIEKSLADEIGYKG